MASPAGTPPETILGIDLGTTNSLVAICDHRGPRILPDAQGRPMLPSVVRYEEGAQARGGLRTIVGAQARDTAASHPASTVHSVKRLMGRSLADATPDLPYLHYAVAAGDNDTARIKLPFAAALISPQEVSAAILAALKTQAEAALGHPVAKAVITVPAYFDDSQRQATRDAGRLAGLEVVRIVNEPTAAALAYGLGVQHTAKHTEPRTVAVYDLGGGTFDISILRITPATTETGTAFFQVLATAGDTHLGGDDIDQALVALLARDLAAKGALPPDAAFKALLRREAERVKIVLSDRDAAEASLSLPGGDSFKRAITREELESLIEPLLQRTLAACKRAVTDAKLTAPVDAAVLVGGATRTPVVRARVGAFFGVTPYTAIDPDQAVALGAAVQASILSGSHKGSLLLDVIPLSLGIETAGGAVAKILTRNTTIPARAREIFSTEIDGQTSIKIHVLQGEREMAEHCRSLGVFHLRGIPPMPAGIPQLEVEFLADASGVLHVSAHERRSGRRAQLQVVPSHGLSRDEVDRIERESFTHAREDMARHRVVDLVVNSRLDLKWIGERLDRFGPRLDPAVFARLTVLAAELQNLVDRAAADWHSVDPDLIYRTKESLDRQSIPLQELSIAESLRASQPPQTPPPPRM